jgi:hypothetical protein
MKFERHPEKQEHIGTGAYKRAYKIESVGGVPEVQLVMKYEYTNEQMKGLYYLNKIATTLFPGKIARVKQAGNFDDEEGKSSQFVAEYHSPDAQHLSMQHHAKSLDGNYWPDTDDEEESAREFERLSTERSRFTRRHPGIQEFRNAYEQAGFANEKATLQIGWGAQDVTIDEKGNFVYIDIDIPWDEPDSVGEESHTIKCLRFDPEKLQTAINAADEANRQNLQSYFDRLMQLCKEAGFVL